MFLTSKSEKNILYILKNYKEYINANKIKVSDKKLIEKIFNLLHESVLASKKIVHKNNQINDNDIIIREIENLSKGKYFPEDIYNYLNEYINYKFSYNIKFNNCNIDIDFYSVINDKNEINKIYKYLNKYIKLVKSWLFICNFYSRKKIKNLNIKIFFTPFIKKLPNEDNTFKKCVLSSFHVNTGYTHYGYDDKKKNIVIYRKEEWFKVFIHETIHAFDLDFNTIDPRKYNNLFKQEFKYVDSDFNFNEAYCEFWADIMNLSYYSYDYSNGNINHFLLSFQINISLEKIFSTMQLNKILNYYNLNYDIVISNDEANNQIIKNIYKEDSNVFCYYILKSILLFNYDKVFQWCNKNNLNFIQFKLSEENINKFLKLLFSLKNNKKFKSTIHNTKHVINNNNLEMCLFEYSM